MARIVLLALAAAVFPTLIACTAIMISRPEPRRLLLAFYAGGMIVSITAGFVVLAVFNRGDAVLGNTVSGVHPGTSIAAGAISLLLAWLLVSGRGRSWLDRWRSHHPRQRDDDAPSWAERHLGRANAAVAFGVGAAINLPGPFYLLALGDLASGDYGDAETVALILLFNLIMFLLLEVPLVGYLVRPDATEIRVAHLATWLNANGLKVTGCLIGAVGVGLVAQGVAAAT